MTENNDNELIKKRQEIKAEIKLGKYKSLGRVMLDETGRLIQKVTFSKKPSAFWLNSVVFALLTLLICTLVAIFLGNPDPTHISPETRFNLIIAGFLGILGGSGMVIVGAIIYERLLATLGNDVLDVIETKENLNDLQNMLTNSSNKKVQLLTSLVIAIVFFSFFVFIRSAVTEGIDLSVYIIAIIAGFQGLVSYPVVLAIFTIPHRLSGYQLKLFAADPSSSEVIDCLSDAINSILFIAGIALTAFTIWLFIFNPPSVAIYVLPLPWAVLIAIFASSHYALSKTINRAKWKTLNGIQAQIEALQMQEEILNKETLSQIKELLDYHNQIKSTRNSALDIRAGLSLLQSLLLPVIGLLLANLLDVLDVLSQFTNAGD